MSASDSQIIPEDGAHKDLPPAYVAPGQLMQQPPYAPPPMYQAGLNSPQSGYPIQYPPQAGYPPQVAYSQQQGGVIMTAPQSTVIVRSTTAQPSDYMVFAIFVTLCCCLPFGLVGIVKASESKSLWAAGDIEGSNAASREAMRWSLAGLITGIVLEVVSVVAVIVWIAGWSSYY